MVLTKSVYQQAAQRVCQNCRAVSSKRLIPGDVIVVLPGRATCDLVLLQGNCLVEESNLPGETTASIHAHNAAIALLDALLHCPISWMWTSSDDLINVRLCAVISLK